MELEGKLQGANHALHRVFERACRAGAAHPRDPRRALTFGAIVGDRLADHRYQLGGDVNRVADTAERNPAQLRQRRFRGIGGGRKGENHPRGRTATPGRTQDRQGARIRAREVRDDSHIVVPPEHEAGRAYTIRDIDFIAGIVKPGHEVRAICLGVVRDE
ncbi:MAG: hypothetical protein O3A10_14495 [Chloroflexi bacterium]|nr:hypothetical protein [Chloroflexota bacterium]MDA1148141.1 hypothetical protein [Chloroflexota bacterium]